MIKYVSHSSQKLPSSLVIFDPLCSFSEKTDAFPTPPSNKCSFLFRGGRKGKHSRCASAPKDLLWTRSTHFPQSCSQRNTRHFKAGGRTVVSGRDCSLLFSCKPFPLRRLLMDEYPDLASVSNVVLYGEEEILKLSVFTTSTECLCCAFSSL